MAILVIFLIMIINLRGVRESGRCSPSRPTSSWEPCFLTLAVGFVRYLAGDLPTVEDVEAVHEGTQAVTLFLVLRAFSSGSAAMTGIEAISNGVTAFKEPRSRNAAITLIWMTTLLVITFGHHVHRLSGPRPAERNGDCDPRIGRTVFGERSILYLAMLSGTALILLMAANTGFAGFPRLAALAAADGFLPRQLTIRGGRLVYSWGIIGLAAFASLLVIVMNARTTALIPLYAIGVFLSFTISQIGMVVHMRKMGRLQPGESVQGRDTELYYDPNWRVKMVISGIGAICTGIVAMVFAITKFSGGAWFVLVLIPTLVFIFRIHAHYQDVARALSLQGVLVDIDRAPSRRSFWWTTHAETVRLVNFAKSLVALARRPCGAQSRPGENGPAEMAGTYRRRQARDPALALSPALRADPPVHREHSGAATGRFRARDHGPPGDGYVLGAGAPPEHGSCL